MKTRSGTSRRAVDLAVKILSAGSALVALLALGWILFEVMRRGEKALDFNFFTRLPTPPGMEGGGLANAMIGTLFITLLATLIER